MIKIIDLDNIKLVGVNKKYVDRKFHLSKEYRDFKKLLFCTVKNVVIPKDHKVLIIMETALDIDNPIKPILDGIEKVFKDDKNIKILETRKIAIKRGKTGRLRIYADTLKSQCNKCGAEICECEEIDKI
jgi:Holliday junction resolvase RusA-like endonuclease